MDGEADLYEVLQVSPRAEPEVLEAAYHRLARKYHPDASQDPADAGRMAQINQAYAVLSDPANRAAYDRRRAALRPGPVGPAARSSGASRRPAAATRPPSAAPSAPQAPSAPRPPGRFDVSRVAIVCRPCRSAAFRKREPIGWPQREHFREKSTLRCTDCGRHWQYNWTIDHPLVLDPQRERYSPSAGRVVRNPSRLRTLLLIVLLLALSAVVIIVGFPDTALWLAAQADQYGRPVLPAH